jgi:uncharacterized protein YndB with AHSA1/START domain
MSTQRPKLIFNQYISAPPALVFRAFTNASSLREWLCDVATVEPRPGGRIYLNWAANYYASGEYTQIEPERLVAFTWQGRGESKPTQVLVTVGPRPRLLVTRVWGAPRPGTPSRPSSKAGTMAWKAWPAWRHGPDLRHPPAYAGHRHQRVQRRDRPTPGIPSQGIRLDNVEGWAQLPGCKDDVIVGLDDRSPTSPAWAAGCATRLATRWRSSSIAAQRRKPPR